MSREDPHFRLRLPEDLHERIRIAAATSRRSITAEVVARLQASFDESPALIDTIRASAPDVMKMLDEISAKIDRIRPEKDEG